MCDGDDVDRDCAWREGRLIAENAELADRLRRLGPALADMARDLACARRENVALKRENLRLQALLAGSRQEPPGGFVGVSRTDRR